MKKVSKGYYLLLWVLVIFTACAEKSRYMQTNKLYKEQVKVLAETIAKVPEPIASTTTLSQKVHQQGLEIPQEWVGTVNFNLRKPNFVVLHYTAQDSVEQTLKTFTMESTQVSAHYVVSKDGNVIQMLNDYLRAWHAGAGKWGNQADLNSCSIGIEIDNNGKEPFTTAQINQLLVLLDTLKTRYNIPSANFIGHSDLAPGRKIDPGVYFPWKLLAEKGFGYWYDENAIPANVPPLDFDPKVALRVIGYDIKNYNWALRAFKLHFFPTDKNVDSVLDARQCAILYQLYLKYL